jgi:transcriptional antiterminator NusG
MILPESETVDGQISESADEPKLIPEAVAEENSHLFAVRTTGGQEKLVMKILESRMKLDEKDDEEIQKAQEENKEIELKDTRLKNIQSVLLVDDLKGYVVVEAEGVSAMFNAIQGIRHIRGQLRGELEYSEIENYLIKKSTVSELSVDNTVEIIAGPFKGMKATVSRIDHEKEEAIVILLDAPYQLPVTIDANFLKALKNDKN